MYDAECLGIQVVTLPRYADRLRVTGSVTQNREMTLRKTSEAGAKNLNPPGFARCN